MSEIQFDKDRFIHQGLAMANNYICTGRPNKAVEMLGVVNQMSPNNDVTAMLMQNIFCNQLNQEPIDCSSIFGRQWLGENLDNKTIQIFCDQGMGDNINLLRYVKELKNKYNCGVMLNCYAFYNSFERLIDTQKYIDGFTPFHVLCDYQSNIMSIPAILSELAFDVYYPAHFKALLEQTEIPSFYLGDFPSVALDGDIKIGLVWQSNSDNPLSKAKSINIDQFNLFKEIENVNYYCLQPKIETPDWIVGLDSFDLYHTIMHIMSMDVVISVDTVVLHLAGSLGKKALGLLPIDADPRWGSDSTTIWYPSVELFRQNEQGWEQALLDCRNRLVSLLNIM